MKSIETLFGEQSSVIADVRDNGTSRMPKIEQIRLKNFKAFRDVEMRDIPSFAVLIGKNGVGKSTFFEVFEFMRDAMGSTVSYALNRLGGERGLEEVRSRGTDGSIEIEIKFRSAAIPKNPLVTYLLEIGSEGGEAIVQREILKYRRGERGQPWKYIDFSYGKGEIVVNESSAINGIYIGYLQEIWN